MLCSSFFFFHNISPSFWVCLSPLTAHCWVGLTDLYNEKKEEKKTFLGVGGGGGREHGPKKKDRKYPTFVFLTMQFLQSCCVRSVGCWGFFFPKNCFFQRNYTEKLPGWFVPDVWKTQNRPRNKVLQYLQRQSVWAQFCSWVIHRSKEEHQIWFLSLTFPTFLVAWWWRTESELASSSIKVQSANRSASTGSQWDESGRFCCFTSNY